MPRLAPSLARALQTSPRLLQQPHTARVPTFVLYSGGQECALCDEALDLLDAMDQDFDLEVVNIRGQPDSEELRRLRRRYQYSIPVLTLEGNEVMHGKIQRSAVLKALRDWHAAREG